MILSGDAIRARLELGQIFKAGTWKCKHLKQASYALRVAPDGLMLEGTQYRPEEDYYQGDIVIGSGKIAILSTMEKMNMPSDLLGKIGIRFKYACQGLTGLMGIQVDPFYGRGHPKERLYIRVANLGNDDIVIPICAEVFTFELHVIYGNVSVPSECREPMWHRIQNTLANQANKSWSNVTQVQENVADVENRLENSIKAIKDYLQPLVIFGIFLVAVTILGVVLTVIVSGSDIPEVYVPTWVRNWGWKVLLGTLSAGAIATSLMGLVTVGSVACQFLRQSRRDNPRLNTGWVRRYWRKFWHWLW